MATRTISEIINTLNVCTADYMEDAVSVINNDNFVSSRLLKKSKSVAGGRQIEAPLKYGRENVESLTPYQQYNFQPVEVADKAYYDWKHINGPMVISIMEAEVQNSSTEQLIDLARMRTENMSETMRNHFSELLFTAVASLETSDPDSLIKMVATTNNTVGGINAATETRFDWNPTVHDYTSNDPTYDNLIDPTSAYYVESLFRKILGPLTYGNDKPSIGLCNQALWDAYETVLREAKRFNDSYMEADGGFEVLKFRSMMIHVDQHVPGGKLNQVDDNEAMLLVLNEKYLGYRHSPDYNFAWTKWFKLEQQPDLASHLDWIGSFVCYRRDRQGAILGLPTDYQAHGSW